MDEFERLLWKYNYDPGEIAFIADGFRNGFDIGYRGPPVVQLTSQNLKLRVGSEVILWNKIMKEVRLKRFAGPFEELPFDTYIQSPVGLVPKGENDTRLIFHLSHPRTGGSLNGETPEHLCSVQYCDFADAVRACLDHGKSCSVSKSDFSSAFHILGIRKDHWKYLVLKARSPLDHKIYFFVDKCLPFGGIY